MNIVFLHRLWPSYGGGETVTKCLANEFIKRGHTVHVAYFKDSINTNDSIQANPRIITHKIEGISFNEFSNEFFVNKHETQIASKELIDYVNNRNIDIVINQWWPVEFHQGIREHTKARVIKCLHMDPNTRKIYEFTGLKKYAFNIIEPIYRKIETVKHIYSSDKYLRNCDKYLFLAPSFLKYYRATSKAKNRIEKTDYVYNPLVFEDYITDEEFEKKENRVLFVGRLVEGHKKVSRILNIWERYEREYNDDWQLDIVGDGPDRGRYEDFVKNHGMRRVSFYGFKDPTPYYRRASIFLMTSAYEGWGMTFVESQQNGMVPIGMSTYLAIFDQIENRQNGIIVPDSDEDAMYNEMVALIRNPEQRRIMAKRGLETCKRYTVDKIADKWEKIFNELKFGVE